MAQPRWKHYDTLPGVKSGSGPRNWAVGKLDILPTANTLDRIDECQLGEPFYQPKSPYYKAMELEGRAACFRLIERKDTWIKSKTAYTVGAIQNPNGLYIRALGKASCILYQGDWYAVMAYLERPHIALYRLDPEWIDDDRLEPTILRNLTKIGRQSSFRIAKSKE